MQLTSVNSSGATSSLNTSLVRPIAPGKDVQGVEEDGLVDKITKYVHN